MLICGYVSYVLFKVVVANFNTPAAKRDGVKCKERWSKRVKSSKYAAVCFRWSPASDVVRYLHKNSAAIGEFTLNERVYKNSISKFAISFSVVIPFVINTRSETNGTY